MKNLILNISPIVLSMLFSCSDIKKTPPDLRFSHLPSIPDTIGYAGSFAGVVNGTLIVAGGANFPDGGLPWKGAKKVWSKRVFALERGDEKWEEVGFLPKPLGYGVSVTWGKHMIIAGGGNERSHTDEVWLLHYENKKISFSELPKMPKPIANATGVVLKETLYIMGGISSPSSTATENNFWALNIADPSGGWKVLETWPGPSRMLAVAGVHGENLFLFSGAALEEGKRTYLSDAYVYHIKKGWSQVASVPQAIVAAPSPAFSLPKGLLVFGGDDGTAGDIRDPAKHPGFSKNIFFYDVQKNCWTKEGALPDFPSVTVPLVCWQNKVVMPGGEIKPAIRTTRVLAVETKN